MVGSHPRRFLIRARAVHDNLQFAGIGRYHRIDVLGLRGYGPRNDSILHAGLLRSHIKNNKHLAFVDTALGRRVGLHARISRGTGTRWSARNCRPYCGVALLLVRSADGGCHVHERDYKIFEDRKKAEDTRVVQERRAGLIDRLLNAANKPGEKTKAEGTPVKEVAPAK